MSSEQRKAWEREQRRNRLVDIAQEIFFKKGFEKTTITEIAKAAGYTKRSLYLYFKDREEIFLAVVLRGLTIMHDTLKHALDSTESKRTRLGLMGQAFHDFSLAHPEYLKLIMIYESDNCIYYKAQIPSVGKGEFADACQAKTDGIAELMTEAINQGIKNGTIITSLTPVQLMLILWGHVLGVMQIISIRKEHFKDAYGINYRELFDASLRVIETGLSVE